MNNNVKIGSLLSAEKVSMGLSQLGSILATKKFWVELVIMTVGMFVAALGVYFFLIPSKLIIGSITGLSLVLAKLLPFISVGSIIFVINAILLILSFVLIGNEFGAKTVYTALILGPMIDFIGSIFPNERVDIRGACGRADHCQSMVRLALLCCDIKCLAKYIVQH